MNDLIECYLCKKLAVPGGIWSAPDENYFTCHPCIEKYEREEKDRRRSDLIRRAGDLFTAEEIEDIISR